MPPGYSVETRHAKCRSYQVVVSSEGKVLKSRRAAWRYYESNAQPPPQNRDVSQAQDSVPSVHRSPGMQYLLRSYSSSSELQSCLSRADVLRAPPGSFGPCTESIRAAAVSSVLSYVAFRQAFFLMCDVRALFGTVRAASKIGRRWRWQRKRLRPLPVQFTKLK